MKTATLFIAKMTTMGAISSSVFLFSNLALPLKTETKNIQTQLPRMTVQLSEFSGAWAALEDDYYVADADQERIPENIPAKPMQLGQVDMMAIMPTQKPALTQVMSAQTFAIPKTTITVPKTAVGLPAEIQPRDEGLRVPHHWIQGRIELTGGLAISSATDTINIGWMVDGQPDRVGQINLRDGTYEIKVDFMDGELIAEVVDGRGHVLGETILDLETLSQQRNTNELVVKNVDIKIEPYQFGFRAQTVTIYDSPSSRSPVAKANVRVGKHDLYFQSEENGIVREESINPRSTALITASRSQFRDTLVISDVERLQKIKMLPNKFLNAFFETIKMESRARDKGLVWGTVNRFQEPAAGYQVRVIDHPELQPLYFNMYLPTPNQQATSTDGQYVFVNMPDGEYELEVLDGIGQRVDVKLVSVKAGFVSQSEFEVGRKKTVSVRPFDPLSSAVREVQVAQMGSDHIHDTQTEKLVRLPIHDGSDPFIVYTRATNAKVDASVFTSRQRKTVDIPILNNEWWERISGERKIRVEEGVVVGFIDTDAPFEVFVEDMNPQTKIVYFDRNGSIISTEQKIVPNGFIIYGAGYGLKTLILQSESGPITTEMAYLDGETVSLTYKAL